MMTREELEAALDRWSNNPVHLTWEDVICLAARKQLALMAENCGTCGGVGEDGFDRNASHTEDRYVGWPCIDCHGSGKVYPPETVEKIKTAIQPVIRNLQPGTLGEALADRVAVAVLDALGETE